MYESLIKLIDQQFSNKLFLTVADVQKILDCNRTIIERWSKRQNPKRRPPRIRVGNENRFPKNEFVKWLLAEQAGAGTMERE